MSDDMRREMDGLKAAVEKTNALIEGMGARFDKLDAKVDRTIVTVSQLVGSVYELDRKVSGMEIKMVTRDEFHSRMDGFAGLAEDSRQRWAVHANTLVEHDKRLKKLETPDS